MQNIPKFDQAFCYSGFDGNLFAELLPAQLNYWFVNILGGNYFAASEISISELKILFFLSSHKFKFHEATWQQEKSSSFIQNPFLASTSPLNAMELSQSGIPNLPQNLKSTSIKVFKKQQTSKSHSAYTFFVVTADYQFLKIGFSKNPSSRLAELESTWPQALLYLGSFASSNERFEELCHKFEHLLVRNNWYKFTSELEIYVENLMSHK